MAGIKGRIIRMAGTASTKGRVPRPGQRYPRGWAALLGAALFTLAVAGAADARIVKGPGGGAETDPRMVFGRIARAWEDGDQQTLADLVHASGLKVTSGGDPDRDTHYSPSQAFYYFKNVFQTHRTMVFLFEKTQDGSEGDRVHGMAVWKRRRPDSDRVEELRLVCIMARQGDGWRLAEINTIR
jgi:hypothetical protein